jgi:DNA-binding transcriptional regulator GbsR (MarR family)
MFVTKSLIARYAGENDMISRQETPHDIFIEGWGGLGTTWGISKVMAEIFALLYLSSDAMTLEDMSNKLKTSRSNISMNVRSLVDLGVVNKVIIRGERKDYYTAEDNISKIAKLLAIAKKKKELDPAIEILDKALAAADASEVGDDEERKFLTGRLNELKRHMDFVNAIFQSFVGTEGESKPLSEIIKPRGKL